MMKPMEDGFIDHCWKCTSLGVNIAKARFQAKAISIHLVKSKSNLAKLFIITEVCIVLYTSLVAFIL